MEAKIYQLFKKYQSVSTDSRNCSQNALFFALKGDNFDGNKFAATALKNGCSYAIIDNDEFATDERYIVVEDTLKALQNLALKHRTALNTQIIGITGTNGKTTTKELIASALSEKFNIHYTKGNLNNHIGVPLTLLQLNKSHEIAIVEMGASHPKEIETLCNIANPSYGIITNVGKAHLEGFGSFEGVMQTKSELYQHLQHNGGKIFINSGNHYLLEMAQKSGFSTSKDKLEYAIAETLNAELAVATQVSSTPMLRMNCQTTQGEFYLQTNLTGKYNAENVLAAVAIAKYFELDNEQIKQGIEKYQPTNNRSEYRETKSNKIIIDAYNANPTSMKASIENFTQIKSDNKILILGDMLELGSYAEQEHQKIVDFLNDLNFNQIFLIGKNFEKTNAKYPKYKNIEALITEVKQNKLADQLILLKGSRGIRLEKILEHL